MARVRYEIITIECDATDCYESFDCGPGVAKARVDAAARVDGWTSPNWARNDKKFCPMHNRRGTA